MKTSARGISLIARYEGLKLTAYLPTKDDVWTIGYGYTRGVRQGDTITQARALELLREDISDAEKIVNSVRANLTQSMFDALVSLVYNTGPSSISPRSTIGRALEDLNYDAAGAAFTLWVKQKGKTLQGLVNRRKAEQELFWQDGYPQRS